MARIAINGFGRIGRAFFKLALEKPELDIVAINDLGDIEFLAYLLRFDSVYGKFKKSVSIKEGNPSISSGQKQKFLVVGGKETLFLQEKDPLNLPWKDLGVDIVVESTGVFESYEKARVHIAAGAKRVVLTAPAKDEDGSVNSPQVGPDGRTVLVGVNDDQLKTCTISSNGSCTTNSVSPVMQILTEKLGVKKAYLNTTHGYTATQVLMDGLPGKSKDFRRGRAAAANIIPSTTGATTAVARAIESLRGKFDGISLRVPVLDGSISAITFISEKPTTVEEINNIFKEAEKDPRWQGILRTTEDPVVSTDIVGDPCAAIADLSLTRVVDGDLCCVYSWYDNEFGYTNTLVRHVIKVAATL
ncbi:MAG: type I glyceraldehyde-3-phosphate dehydrogenase [Candidatus Yanofskybacteria bacterium RIFCSPHIGHO2_01_FULL_45_42]|uniref:Type I glyceraldehyde-3-phosphate dehydrogenase n=3 Tax=Candidatus Yanofskyibacteriota TaxID=1752733 RepID=A0A1F8F583_9BACT|nr:MAG: type I glyceraldehyde-3-phosphate dehydrogenase [Candidatus Yanofskybacteria bacterium RIFCSPHIGHO2_01_FULL_45_42]OGN16386.1 MAG: type I glyceraldehyde-3-phosphate dehydrogenase [Candidatus Yanofskybacteria bacterium RIFCSPHIGHO2_02_FULL_46_19]OGN27059.1 MAG: type I glyceraldehyde-3-phosphate dehydrogenase [Candidatus Yanofskybacteria bacterium RIFCSPLOWO2_01_FULL_45_72]OGN32363.1 MAG: type I glyceraldehyde-3-phosphate dehydrogenase [Candidatus Yanofskybacteria bacterium RIFCSPLOWO2_02_F